MITNMERTAFGSLGPSQVDFFNKDEHGNNVSRNQADKREGSDVPKVGTQTTLPAITATKIDEVTGAANPESVRSRRGSRMSNGVDFEN